MSKDLAATLADLTEHLAELVSRDDRLRDRLRSLILAVLEPDHPSIDEPEPIVEPVVLTEPIPEPIPDPNPFTGLTTDPTTTILESPQVEAPPPPPPVREPLRKLTLGQSQPRPAPTPPVLPSTQEVDDELTGIEVRTRLKAEGLRWAVRRRQIETSGGDFRLEIAPHDRELLDRAAGIRCHLWMNRSEYVVPTDPSQAENAARWFEALAIVTELVREMGPDAGTGRQHREPALDLMAEAQSALRVAVGRVGGHNDPDQFQAYQWLRKVAENEHIFIKRYMKLNDPASSVDPAEFGARVARLAARLREGRHRISKSGKSFKQFEWHARLIAKQGGGDRSHDWRKMAEAVDGLIKEGHPPSAVDVRELLLPIIDQIPDDLGEISPAFGRVLREVDAYLASRLETTEMGKVAEQPTEAVVQAARLLEGKVMVLIGGQCRPYARDAIKAAFRLKELDWISSKEHTSIDRFEPNVTRPGVAMVALAIRWSSHSYGEVKEFCERHDKPMVRLTGGYGVNTVAAQVLAQCSGQLRGD